MAAPFQRGPKREGPVFGAEYFATRPFVYDDLKAYVSRTAPEILPQVAGLVAAIRPFTGDVGAYLAWFRDNADDKQSYVWQAEQLYDLIAGTARRPGGVLGDRGHAVAATSAERSAGHLRTLGVVSAGKTFQHFAMSNSSSLPRRGGAR